MDIEKLTELARAAESPLRKLVLGIEQNRPNSAAEKAAHNLIASYAVDGGALRAAYQQLLPETQLVGRNLQLLVAERMGIPPGISAAATAYGNLTRRTRWASILGDAPDRSIHELLGSSPVIDELKRVRLVGHELANAAAAARASSAYFASVSNPNISEALYATRFKFSAFAGATDVLGPGAAASAAALASLMGRYHTTANLPRAFWRNLDVRRETYREAAVDDGLIDADPSETVEMFIDSGVAEPGRSRGSRPVAVLQSGPIRVHIAASQPKVGAFRTIDAFEQYLRSFVALKMETVAGAQWLKHRVHGKVVTAAKQRRRDALLRGEPHQPLVNFLHLGELCAIILQGDNWETTFEAIFVRREHLQVDIERLIAVRNPTDHARRIDAVQLSEVVLTTYNLRAHMERTGPADTDWDEDW